MKDRSAYFAAYRAARRDALRQTSAEWRNNNKELEKQRTADYRERNREVLRQRYRDLYARKKEERKKLSAEYKRANRAAYRVYHLNRKRALAHGSLSPNIVAILLERQSGACMYCGSILDDGLHVDHVMPVALGGTNTDDNVQLLCPACNMAKGAMHPEHFKKLRACS